MNAPRPVVSTLVGAGGAHLRALLWEEPGSEARVVVVHGLGDHAGRYDLLAGAMMSRGFSVLAYDQRGHGASEGRRGHVEDFALFLEDLHLARAEAELRLPGLGPPFLVGHSMGGLVLLRYLQTYRPSTPGAVLSAPWLATAHAVPAWKRLLGRLLLRVAPDVAVREELPPEDLTRDEARRSAYERDPLVHHLITPRLWDQVRTAQSRALEQGVEPTIPTLVLVPGDDRVADSGRTLRWARSLAAPNVRAVELEGRRHEPFNDLGREEVFALLADWMDAHRRGEPEEGGRVSSPPG